MNKLKNVFQRSSQKVKAAEERRPQQFVKRHSAMATPIITTTDALAPPPPAINLSELSEMEKPAYQAWWKDLDPFDLQKINNKTILKFLNGCSLPDNKLEQILALFETAGDGLNELQFFAMLRLIAHAQNGRKISRALVYLGAPVPYFHKNAIEALIKSSSTDLLEANKENRKSWWGNEKPAYLENRRSYMGPYTTSHHAASPIIDLFYPTAIQPSYGSVTITPLTPNVVQLEEKHTHSRSRSAGTVKEFIHNPYQQVEDQQLASSRSSLSLHELNTGQSLLLTQRFVYQSPSIRHQELQEEVTNPFNPVKEDMTSPFDDEKSIDDEKSVGDDHINYKPNTFSIPPPPVPNQLTKPAFPKYTRTNTFIKRSQSTVDKKHNTIKHQRHKSTSATDNIFY